MLTPVNRAATRALPAVPPPVTTRPAPGSRTGPPRREPGREMPAFLKYGKVHNSLIPRHRGVALLATIRRPMARPVADRVESQGVVFRHRRPRPRATPPRATAAGRSAFDRLPRDL